MIEQFLRVSPRVNYLSPIILTELICEGDASSAAQVDHFKHVAVFGRVHYGFLSKQFFRNSVERCVKRDLAHHLNLCCGMLKSVGYIA